MFTAWSALLLSTDGFLVALALALSGLVERRAAARLALGFGVCDMVASGWAPVLSATVAPQLAHAALAVALIVLLAGALDAIRLRHGRAAFLPTAWAWLLPPLLALDNLCVPGASPLATGLAGAAMAALGFACGAALPTGAATGARPPLSPIRAHARRPH